MSSSEFSKSKAMKLWIGLTAVLWGSYTGLRATIGGTCPVPDLQEDFDRVIYGHQETKNQVLRLIASTLVNRNESKGGERFALGGPPGTGKTQIAAEIAKAFGRPLVRINLAGSSNGDDLVGHGYTYEGSMPGKIVNSLIEAGCNDPVILFDELDKVSKTAKGDEINNVLIHITDSTQNHEFQDKYLSGINIDLSKAIMIFSFNDESNISPILLDRMKIINVDGYKIDDKVIIAQKHLIPSIKKDLGVKYTNYIFDDFILRDIINQYTFEGGVRKLKGLITDIFMELNLRRLTDKKVNDQDITDNMLITKELLRKDLFKDKRHVRHTMRSETNQVGLVNGLWANSYGIGGLIPVESYNIPTPTPFELQLTGMQGDVMKESMKVAKSVAWRLVDDTVKEKIRKDWKKVGPTGIHIHCPDGSTPKDGPSAGGAITTCLVSLMSDRKVNQNYAMTGEINLKGEITAIGGLEEKLFGAITAGIKTVLYPKENEIDMRKIKEKFPNIFDNKEINKNAIEVISVDRIEQILDKVLI